MDELKRLYIDENIARVSHSDKLIVLHYGLFHSGTNISNYEKYGEQFLYWLVRNEKYDDYKIVIDQSSEPLCNAGMQSHGNRYYWNYKSAAKILRDREVWFISDSDTPEYTNWIKTTFGFNTLPYHFHFNNHVCDSFYFEEPEIRNSQYDKRFIIINGNIENSHKPKAMELFTELNLWDDSYWSYDKFSNFGMDIFKNRWDLFQIFRNLKPLFHKSFLYIVTETISDNYYMNSRVPMDFMSKMGRALRYPTPFVVVGNKGLLKRLHDMGFKTFSEFWDESYDNHEDLNDRLSQIKKVLEYIKNLPMNELVEIRNKMIPIFQHNREVLRNLQEKENLEILKLFPTLYTSTYEKFNYIKMNKFKIQEGTNNIDVLYYKDLDGGGTTFGINALKSQEVEKCIKPGNVLEMCSGPGFMGFYLKAKGLADNLYLVDINESNRECIDSTILYNNFTNVEFIKSDCFDNIPKGIIFDTIVSNPPHFKTERPGGYRTRNEKIISLDTNMKIHKSIFDNAKHYMNKDSRLILVENCDGVTEEDIRKKIDGVYGVEYVEYNSYGWEGKSTFYIIILYLL